MGWEWRTAVRVCRVRRTMGRAKLWEAPGTPESPSPETLQVVPAGAEASLAEGGHLFASAKTSFCQGRMHRNGSSRRALWPGMALQPGTEGPDSLC